MGLWKIYGGLPAPSQRGRYSVGPGEKSYRVGRSFDSYPAMMFSFPTGGGSSAPRHLANLTYEPPARVELSSSSGVREVARLAILECRTTDPQLCAYFFRIVESVFLHADATATEDRFEAALDALVKLFRALERPGLRPLEGLWAELAIVAWSADPSAALSSWHSSPRALHDFSAGSYRLEVKATQKSLREHTFLLDQLASFHPGVTLVASVMLRETFDGASVFDLIEMLRAGLAPEPIRRLETIVAESVGEGWRDAEDVRFSIESARRSLRVYPATAIPTIPQPLPPEIKEVRFLVDLSDVDPLDMVQARALGPLFGLLLPPESTR